MKKSILTFTLFLLTIQLFAQKSKEIVHYNVVFAPDLSNRLNPSLYPKAVDDANIIEGVLNNIWEILRLKRSEGQQDHYSVDFINKKLISLYNVNPESLEIDFQRFGKQNDRINYVKARGVPRTLKTDVSAFMLEYRKLSSKAAKSNNGADIWSYFQSGIDERIVLPHQLKGKVNHKFRNIMIMPTDGYIEAGIYNKGYDLSASKVSDFRKAFLKSKESSMEVFLSKNNRFKIAAAKNPYLRNLEIIVIEMYDRSLSRTGAATSHPTDMEIMKVIWSDWLRSSGVKRFELKSTASTKAEAVKYIMNFIET